MMISISPSPVSTVMSLLGGITPDANPATAQQPADSTSPTSSSATTTGAKHAHHHHGGGAGSTSFSDLLSAITGQTSDSSSTIG